MEEGRGGAVDEVKSSVCKADNCLYDMPALLKRSMAVTIATTYIFFLCSLLNPRGRDQTCHLEVLLTLAEMVCVKRWRLCMLVRAAKWHICFAFVSYMLTYMLTVFITARQISWMSQTPQLTLFRNVRSLGKDFTTNTDYSPYTCTTANQLFVLCFISYRYTHPPTPGKANRRVIKASASEAGSMFYKVVWYPCDPASFIELFNGYLSSSWAGRQGCKEEEKDAAYTKSKYDRYIFSQRY